MVTYTVRAWHITRKVTGLPEGRQDMTRQSYASERPGLTLHEAQKMVASFLLSPDWNFIEFKITKEGE